MQRLGCSEEDAITQIQTMWEDDRWNPQGERQSPPIHTPSPIPPPLEISRSLSDNPQQVKGKKVLFPDFEVGSIIEDQIPLTPHKFATKRIKASEYVELWYFTVEGCKEASMASLTADDETFGLLRTESGIAFQQMDATKASRNAIADEHLSWDQIMTARYGIINVVSGPLCALQYFLVGY